MIDKLGIDSEKLKFVSISNVYEYSIGHIVVAKSPSMTLTSNNIADKYHWFRQHAVKEIFIWKIELENWKADIFIKGLHGELFLRIKKFLCG